MKDLLTKLLEQLKNTNAPTRIMVGVAMALLLVVIGLSSYRAANPSFTILRSNLDEGQLASASSAIANASIRFKTSHGPGPYTIWVEDGRLYQALNAIYLEGALSADPRGIETGASGAAAAFMGSGERNQQMQKRKWQEVEKMLEVYNWIVRATVNSSSPTRSSFSRSSPETISVVLQLRGTLEPDREQCATVSTIVSAAFGVDRQQVMISDQYGRSIFDGSRDNSFDEVLAFQRSYDASIQRDVQAALDGTYGPGMAHATVHSEWTYDRVESVAEGVDKESKTPISKRTSKSTTPNTSPTPGGAVGTDANLNAGVSRTDSSEATTSDTLEQYLVGRSTTHTVQSTPVLSRLTVALLLDDSLDQELSNASEWVKGIVGFDLDRGDSFTSGTAEFSGLARDEDGGLLAVEPEPVPEPPNAILELVFERGVEIVAALGFLIVLLKSLKKSDKVPAARTGATGRSKRQGGGSDAADAGSAPSVADFRDEDIDVGLLARQQISDLLANDPERVSAILSRWALDDTFVGSK